MGSHLSFGGFVGFTSSCQVHGGFARLDALQQDLGGTARGHEVEHGTLQEVAEAVAGCPVHVELLNVDGGVEGFHTFRPLTLDADAEYAQVTHFDAFSFQQHLTHAVHGLHQHGIDVGAVVLGSVAGDVLGKLVQRQDVGVLGLGIGLFGRILVDRIGIHGGTVID